MWDVWCLFCFALTHLVFALQVRGVGVGCEAPHLRCILRLRRMDLFPLFFLYICIYGPSGWTSFIAVGKPVISGERDVVLMRPWSGETGREMEWTSGASTKAASSHATSEICSQSAQCNVPIMAISRQSDHGNKPSIRPLATIREYCTWQIVRCTIHTPTAQCITLRCVQSTELPQHHKECSYVLARQPQIDSSSIQIIQQMFYRNSVDTHGRYHEQPL